MGGAQLDQAVDKGHALGHRRVDLPRPAHDPLVVHVRSPDIVGDGVAGAVTEPGLPSVRVCIRGTGVNVIGYTIDQQRAVPGHIVADVLDRQAPGQAMTPNRGREVREIGISAPDGQIAAMDGMGTGSDGRPKIVASP